MCYGRLSYSILPNNHQNNNIFNFYNLYSYTNIMRYNVRKLSAHEFYDYGKYRFSWLMTNRVEMTQ